MGVVGSILTSIVTTMFQLWLTRRENERKQNEERSRQLRHIHLPSDEEVISINARREHGNPEPQHRAAEAGSIVVSVLISSALVYQTNDPMLAFSFAALLGFLFTNLVIRALKR
jgi:hypothetical protein